MKFSALVVALATGSAAAFSPESRGAAPRSALSAATIATVTPVEASAVEAPAEPAAEEAIVMQSTEETVEPIGDGIQPGRYADKANSIAVPFLGRPPALDGSHAGDYGFDPLGFTEEYDLYMLQEAEIRHARLAMLAVVGWPMSELLAPKWMLQEGGCAPSVLNGFNPISFVATVAIFGALGFFEFKTSLRKVDDKELGVIHKEDMADVWQWGVAGDYNFDPLNLYSFAGDDAYARKGLRDVEISHGRSAMLGITAFAIWEKLTGHAIVEDSMFFHPNLLLPALYGAYVGFNQVYELEESDTFYRFKMSSEGEARVENLKIQLSSPETDSVDFEKLADDAKNLAAKLKLGEAYEKAQSFYMDNVVGPETKN